MTPPRRLLTALLFTTGAVALLPPPYGSRPQRIARHAGPDDAADAVLEDDLKALLRDLPLGPELLLDAIGLVAGLDDDEPLPPETEAVLSRLTLPASEPARLASIK